LVAVVTLQVRGISCAKEEKGGWTAKQIPVSRFRGNGSQIKQKRPWLKGICGTDRPQFLEKTEGAEYTTKKGADLLETCRVACGGICQSEIAKPIWIGGCFLKKRESRRLPVRGGSFWGNKRLQKDAQSVLYL